MRKFIYNCYPWLVSAPFGVLATFMFFVWVSSHHKLQPAAPAKLGAIVRLHEASSGRFFCSGTVIDAHFIVTAAHCVIDGGIGSEVDIRAEDGAQINVRAKVLKAQERSDQALLMGDFSRFDSRPLATSPDEVVRSLRHKLMACGYPWGGPLWCHEIKNPRMLEFYFSGDGYLYPGMSGGPVFDEHTGRIVATNFAVINDMVLLAPTVNEWADVNISDNH